MTSSDISARLRAVGMDAASAEIIADHVASHAPSQRTVRALVHEVAKRPAAAVKSPLVFDFQIAVRP